ncbi:MAG: EAL domain-containing protein [Coprococcus comes]
MTYNIDFLIAAMVILLLVLWYFLGQKRAEDLNNQVFLFFAIIGILDVVAELASNYYISFPNSNCEIAAMLATTIFYLLQALLPFTVICYIQTLHDNKIISAKKMFLSGVPTFILMGMILTNPFTEKLFYFDIPAGYMKGPWYMLMYYSALCHMAAALILIVIWRKKLGYQKVKSLLEILLISGAGVVIQLLYHPLLTTGFGMSLGILALFITINNPHANIDTLTGSLEEYEYYLTQLKRMFDGNSKLNVNNKIITMPVIISGIMNAQKLGDSGLILEYAEYLEALSAKNGLTEVIQDDYQTMNGFLYNKRVEQYLHKAITEDLFEIYYQPVYSTRKKCFITLEALSRLQHPELGWIAPDVFIQIAEKNHTIEQITDLQFSRVCRFLGENRYLMRHLLNVKVNLSSLDLMRNDCSRHFIRIMDAYKIPHNWIQFEITETVATECNAGLRRVAEEFTDAGIGLCLDDFGSGYANLNTVMRLPFSVIKVDRSLLFDICRDEKRAIFYESVVETFHKMNYHIVSEGVETQEEMEQISSWGVEMIQGYYFSKPLPEKELLELLKKQDNIER